MKTTQPKQNHKLKFYTFPSEGKSVLAYSYEDALNKLHVDEPATEVDPSTDLNNDGKFDAKDAKIAGKTLKKHQDNK